MKFLLWLLKPRGYNTPACFATLYNQWQHQAFLWGWQTYDEYAVKSRKPRAIEEFEAGWEWAKVEFAKGTPEHEICAHLGDIDPSQFDRGAMEFIRSLRNES